MSKPSLSDIQRIAQEKAKAAGEFTGQETQNTSVEEQNVEDNVQEKNESTKETQHTQGQEKVQGEEVNSSTEGNTESIKDGTTEQETIEQKLAKQKEEYEAKIKELQSKAGETTEFQYANEEIKKLDELAKAGVSIDEEFWRMQSLDLEKFDPSSKADGLELVKLELKANDKSLSDDEVDFLVKRKYKALFDDLFDQDDSEYREALMELKIDSKKAKTSLNEYKEKVQLPKVDISQMEKERELERRAVEKFNEEVKASMASFKEQPFKAGDIELKFSVGDDARKLVESSVINNATFFTDNYVKDGAVDFGRLQRDLLLISQQDKIFKMIYDQGVSAGKSSIADELENATEGSTSQKTETGKSYQEQIAEQIAKKGGLHRFR